MQLTSRLSRSRAADPRRRGAALMLALLVLFVLVAIVFQINIATSTDARVARNEITLTTMDLAIESTLLEVFETLKMDAEADAAEGEGAAAPGGEDPVSGSGFPGEEGGGEESGPLDSKKDDWAQPFRTEVNRIQLRILIQDEDSKYNVLSMLTEDEIEAEKAIDRVTRILDFCREGTKADIDGGEARQMATEMVEHLRNRSSSILPRPELVTDDEEQEDLGLPLSLREFVVLPSFEPDHFRDFRDEDGTVVHSIGSFLTVVTGLQARVEFEQEDDEETGPGAPGAPGGDPREDPEGEELGDGATGTIGGAEGPTGASSGSSGGGGESEATGVAVNINTSPAAVLKALMDDRDVPLRFWDDVIEYRNEEDEEAMAEYEDDPPVDEFGEPIIIPMVFESLEQLDEFDDYRDLDALLQGELQQLLDVKSNVFSIFVTARKPTGRAAQGQAVSKEEVLEEEEAGQALVRTVRCTVWRRKGTTDIELIPLERWEVLDYLPLEVEDFPDEDR